MSSFTDRLYRAWLGGYGAQPHAKRREGYPSGQAKPPETCHRPYSTWRSSAGQVTTRDGSQRAKDAASRPEKQDASEK